MSEGRKPLEGGGWHSMAMKADGQVMTWGANSNGQLGDGTLQDRTQPVMGAQMNLLDLRQRVTAGSDFSMAVNDNGEVWTWGSKRSWSIGTGEQPLMRMCRVRRRCLVILSKFPLRLRTLWHWIRMDMYMVGVGNQYGDLGRPELDNLINAIPFKYSEFYPQLPLFIRISAGGYINYGLTSDGKVLGMGTGLVLGNMDVEYSEAPCSRPMKCRG